jgi:predicted membrane-bound spermidine synthase
MDMSKLKLQQSHLMALFLGGGDGLKVRKILCEQALHKFEF